jgi:hypothetical protein
MEAFVLKTWNELQSELKGFVTLRVRDSEEVKDLLQERSIAS